MEELRKQGSESDGESDSSSLPDIIPEDKSLKKPVSKSDHKCAVQEVAKINKISEKLANEVIRDYFIWMADCTRQTGKCKMMFFNVRAPVKIKKTRKMLVCGKPMVIDKSAKRYPRVSVKRSFNNFINDEDFEPELQGGMYC